jgi:hypothetical protein
MGMGYCSAKALSYDFRPPGQRPAESLGAAKLKTYGVSLRAGRYAPKASPPIRVTREPLRVIKSRLRLGVDPTHRDFNIMSDDPHGQLFRLIGIYFVHWTSFELAVDIGMTKLSGGSAADTVRATQGWTISSKVDRLKKLVQQSGHAEKPRILKVLGELPKASIRNAMAHGYMRFGADRLVVIHRSKNGSVARHEFTTSELMEQLKSVADLAHTLSTYLGNTEAEAEHYIAAVGTP